VFPHEAEANRVLWALVAGRARQADRGVVCFGSGAVCRAVALPRFVLSDTDRLDGRPEEEVWCRHMPRVIENLILAKWLALGVLI